MDRKKWQKLEALFQAASALPDSERADFVERECGDDSELRAELQSLLAASDSDGTFIHQAIGEAAYDARQSPGPLRSSDRVGAFEVVRELGRGGMGTVYLARRADEQFDQLVAIKLGRGAETPEQLQRFRAERQILAGLEHPNIARLVDGGETGHGLPYLVMEYVEGVPIDRFCDEQRLTTRERLDLFRRVCSAVEYAHHRLIVHRDIKPSNILVTADGSPKLLDFGIARLLENDGTTAGGQTATMLRALTPDYASPEQFRGDAVTTATDVYSLGVLLYELLSGSRPYRVSDRQASEIERIVCETNPEPPSTRIRRTGHRGDGGVTPDTVSLARRTPIDRLRKELTGDLDHIVLMAMRKEPERRYGSVEQFSDDLHRYLHKLPVLAQRDTFGYRASKFLRRNAVVVAAAGIVGTTLIASSAVSYRAYRNAVAARQQAEDNLRAADQVTQFLTGLFEEASPEKSRGEQLTALEIVDRGAARIRQELVDEPVIKARVLRAVGNVYTTLLLPDSACLALEEAVRIEREVHGDTHESLANALQSYGDALSEAGRYEDAIRMHQEALSIKARLFGETDPRLAPYMNRIALNHPNMPHSERIDMLRRSLAIMIDAHGEDDPLVAYYYVNVAWAMRRGGDFEGAYEHSLRALDIRERHLEPDDPRLSQSLSSLGSALNRLERFEEAIPYFERSLAIEEKLHGVGHQATAPAINGLGNAHAGLEQFGEARSYFERARAINANAFGEDHPRVGYDHVGIGFVLDHLGETEQARRNFQRAEQIFLKSYGANHGAVADVAMRLGKAEANAGAHDRALTHYDRSLEIRRQLNESPSMLRETLDLKAQSLRALGRDSEADAIESNLSPE